MRRFARVVFAILTVAALGSFATACSKSLPTEAQDGFECPTTGGPWCK